ncbi:MAG: type III pantothenate kinase [Planctomycetes bacterium]|nr:type III pantothenate kinase [Planctomycetota bacterium]
MSAPSIIAISVGNSRIHAGLFINGDLQSDEHFPNNQLTESAHQIVQWWEQIASESRATILTASVNDSVCKPLSAMIQDQLSVDIYRIGSDLPVPIGEQLNPETITGVDRLLNAAAAYATLKQACVVIDAGSAITVDFVDGEGTFLGGAITPGASMQLRSLHENTTTLPELQLALPDDNPFGKSTSQAILHGVFHGIRGMVQRLVEHYAQHYEAFPFVIATGGDAKLLFENEGLVDRIVPQLTLLGMSITAKHALAVTEADDSDVRT